MERSRLSGGGTDALPARVLEMTNPGKPNDPQQAHRATTRKQGE